MTTEILLMIMLGGLAVVIGWLLWVLEQKCDEAARGRREIAALRREVVGCVATEIEARRKSERLTYDRDTQDMQLKTARALIQDAKQVIELDLARADDDRKFAEELYTALLVAGWHDDVTMQRLKERAGRKEGGAA